MVISILTTKNRRPRQNYVEELLVQEDGRRRDRIRGIEFSKVISFSD
jgi:hypothetical protein